MPDLSNLLGAVYGDGESSSDRDPQDEAHVEREPAASERGPKVPDWADDDHLDAAFAEWKPGPAADASPAEHAFVQDTDDAPPPLADDLAAALSEALVAASSGTADDNADTADPVGSRKTHFDFSAPADDDEAPEPLAQPQNLSKSAFAPLEHTETEQPHELGEVVAEPVAIEPDQFESDEEPEPEEEPIAVDHTPEPVAAAPAPEVEEDEDEDQPEVNTWGSVNSQRAAAAELTAANRVEPARAVAEPAPAPQPVAAAAAPLAALDAPTEPIAASEPDTTTPLPGTRRWDRSDDDILPEKAAKKFFSLSLRRG
ncbi:MAG: hypothetical protein JO248_20815 [Acidimicrobiia bacterium]|nr:hypothetical protein [Acidimicrobiia bacterium]